MKKILLFVLCLVSLQMFGQIVNNGAGTFVWTNGAPSHNPSTSGAKFAVDRNTFKWYEWISGTSWTESGERVQFISGCAAPAYTPAIHQSKVVINACTPNPEMYVWGGSAWAKVSGVDALQDLTDVDLTGLAPFSTLIFSDDVYKWVIDTNTIRHVSDSTEFTQFFGQAKTVIMSDADRGGMFRPCTSCTADNYMVFTDANGQKWERFGYDRILASWWGIHGAVSLQRGLDYVGQKIDNVQGVLHMNRPYTLKDTIFVPEGVQFRGISPVTIIGENPLDEPQLNKLYINIADSTKTAITIKANIRGYATASGVNNLIIEVLSKIHSPLDIQKPYKQEIHHLVIGPETSPRRMDYAMKINGAILTQIYDVRTQGARIAAVTDYDDGIAGGTLTFRDCYFTRAKFGILFPQGTGFTMAGGAFENIDSVAIYSTNSFTLRDLYTENTPLGSVGSLISSPNNGIDFIRLYNVTANGGADCATGDCAIFKGGARGVTYTGGFLNQFAKIIATPDSSNYWLLQDLHSLNPTSDTTGLTAHQNVTLTGYYRVSGGTMQSAVNFLKGKYKIQQLADNDNATGNANQFLRANGNNTWSWANILPNQLDAQGAVADDVLTFDGVEWIPQAAPTPPNEIPTSVSGRLVRYNSTTTVDGEPNLFWDAVNTRLGIGTTTPTALLHVNGNADFVGTGSRTINIGRSGGSNLQLASSTTTSIIGTTTATSLDFRTSGITRFTLDATGILKFGVTQITGANNGAATSMLRLYDNINTQRVVFSDFGNIHIGIGSTDASKYFNVIPDGINSLYSVSTTGAVASATLAGSGNRLVQASSTGLLSATLDVSTVGIVIKGTTTLDFPSTGVSSSSDLTVTVTGAVVGDFADVTPLVNPPANSHYTATVTAVNTVTVRFNHYGNAGAVDPASQDFRILIHKQ